MDRTTNILHFTILASVTLLVILRTTDKHFKAPERVVDFIQNKDWLKHLATTTNKSRPPGLLVEEQQWKAFLEEQNKRSQKIQQVCNENGYTYGDRAGTRDLDSPRYSTYFVQNLSVTYCVPPKSGISNWHRVFYASKYNLQADQLETTEKLYLEFPILVNSTLEFSDFEHRLVNVRHPLARLYSCWKDKFQESIYEDYTISTICPE